MVKPSCSTAILSPPLSLSRAMAMASSFCPRTPLQFRACFSLKPQFLLQVKAFSSQEPSKDEMPPHIGFLGTPMAQNLIKAGCDVGVWNGTKSKCDPLIFSGAKYKSSPEEVAASCDVAFAMLADPGSTLDVVCGKHGGASGMSPGKGYVDTSKLISSHIKTTGAVAPVSGSKRAAEDGQLIFLTAGDKALYETAGQTCLTTINSHLTLPFKSSIFTNTYRTQRLKNISARNLAVKASGGGDRRSFLTLEEAGLVEISGLSTHERFLCRLTISSLNLLRVISEQEGCKIEDLNAGRVCDWFLKDKLKREQNLESAVLQWDDSELM